METDCRQQDDIRAQTPEDIAAGGDDVEGEEGEEEKEEEEEDEVDPNDPLYGLDERLAKLNLDENSKAVLRQKLIEAGKSIQEGLEKRQADLDTKVNAMPAKKR